MLGAADKKFCKVLVGAFKDAVERGGEDARPLLDYGRESMELPERSPEAAMWYGFYLGFGAGCEYMTKEDK